MKNFECRIAGLDPRNTEAMWPSIWKIPESQKTRQLGTNTFKYVLAWANLEKMFIVDQVGKIELLVPPASRFQICVSWCKQGRPRQCILESRSICCSGKVVSDTYSTDDGVGSNPGRCIRYFTRNHFTARIGPDTVTSPFTVTVTPMSTITLHWITAG